MGGQLTAKVLSVSMEASLVVLTCANRDCS